MSEIIDAEEFKRFYHKLENESDIGAVLVASSIIEIGLKELIQASLLVVYEKKDPLFDSDSAPLSTLSSKIEMAWRMGLITDDNKKTLTIFRRLRNDFAHNSHLVSLSDASVKERVKSIYGSAKEVASSIDIVASSDGELTDRQKFNVFFALSMMVYSRLKYRLLKKENR